MAKTNKITEVSDPFGLHSALKNAKKRVFDDPVLGKNPQAQPPSDEYTQKSKTYLDGKMKKDDTSTADMPQPQANPDSPISSHHIIFSMESPVGGEVGADATTKAIETLKGMGADIHPIKGTYGGVNENSILVRNPTKEISSAIQDMAFKNGQESILHSNGKEHELHFINGANRGKFLKGSGTKIHTTFPGDNYSELDDGTIFSHNIDFNQDFENK